MIPILILAAGESRRMRGGDKLLEPVGGVPLLRRQAEMAMGFGGDVFVALPRADHPRAAVIDGLAVSPMIVPEAAEGMSGTLRAAMARMPEATDVMVLLGDLPLIDASHLSAVLAARDAQPDAVIWRGATWDGKPGHPIIFANEIRADFAMLEGDGGGEPLVRKHCGRTVLCPLPDDIARLDLDTPEEWAAFRERTGL